MSHGPDAPQPGAHSDPLHWTVDEPGEHPRLDRWLSDRLPDRARNQIRQDIDAGRIQVNGEPRPARYRVAEGDEIAYRLPVAVTEELTPEAIPLDVVFEDDDIVVINKRAGQVVHPAPGHDGGTLANALLAHCGPSLVGVGGEGRWGLIHRLDAGTSGLLVAAKTQPAYDTLVDALAERTIHRQYLGVAVGTFPNPEGTIDRPIGRRPSDRKKMGIVPGGRPARTDWRVLLQDAGMALLLLTLHSGRTHQIRVHLQGFGHPILGDSDYGWTRPRLLAALDAQRRSEMARLWPRRPMLHAVRLRLEHPTEPGRHLEFIAPPPRDFDPVAKAFWGEGWREKIVFE